MKNRGFLGIIAAVECPLSTVFFASLSLYSYSMAGHSKWANIKHKKAAADSRRGKVFTKMAKLITVAAQQGGGDIEMNPSLRMAIAKAKAAGVPSDNIERAVKKGTGELKGDRLEEVIYEGYGPDGVALLVRCLTDNTNRSLSNVRDILNKKGGSLGGSGCVAWMFERKGVFEVCGVQVDKEPFELELIDAGGEEIDWEGHDVRVICPPECFEQVQKVFDGLDVQKAEICLVSLEEKEIDDVEKAEKILGILEKLEDDDDVDEVSSNASFSVGVLEQLSSSV